MYVFRYRFFAKEAEDGGFLSDAVIPFLCSLRSNGQIMHEWTTVKRDAGIEATGLIPDRDSLNSAYHDETTRKAYAKLLGNSIHSPDWELLGEEGLRDSEPCRCQSPSSYVLFTTFADVEPPVLCGDCGHYVPLYHLPKPSEASSYHPILSWQDAYQHCDGLWMGSSVGERFGHRQLTRPDSQLAQQGRAICRDMRDRTSRPFFYYVHLSALAGEMKYPNECPSCGRRWGRRHPVADRFCRRCDSCSLVGF